MNRVVSFSKQKSKYAIFNNKTLLLLLLLPFFEPVYVEHIPLVYDLYVSWKIISASIAIFLALSFNKRPSLFLKLILLSNLFLFISTYFNSGNMVRFFSFALKNITIVLLIEMYIKHNFRVALKTVSLIIGILGTINLIFLLVYPEGIYVGYSMNTPVRYNFLGLDNQLSAIFVPGVILIYIKDLVLFGKIKISSWIYILILMFNIFYTQTATGIIGLLIFIVFYVRKFLPFHFNQKFYLRIFIFLFFGVIIFRFQSIFAFIIEDVFEKSINFSDRTILWDGAIEMIKEKFILGNGIQDSEELIFWSTDIYKNPHNLILNFLVVGGLSVTLIFVYMCYLSLNELKKSNTIIANTLSIGIFSFLIMSLMEVYYNLTLFYVLLYFGFYFKKIPVFKNKQ